MNLTWLPWIFFLAASLSPFSRLTSSPLPSFFLASRMPVSSNVSLMAPMRYAGPSWCLAGESTAGMSPSWNASRLPPGKTCAEAKDVEVLTRWRRRTWFWGETRTTEELGRGSFGPSEAVGFERLMVDDGAVEYNDAINEDENDGENEGRVEGCLSHRR